jgi:molybdopterin converting factor small subunit
MVEVELNLLLIELVGKSRATLDIKEPIHLSKLIELVGLRDEDVGMLLINKQWAPLDVVVNDGDYVQLYPNLEGG